MSNVRKWLLILSLSSNGCALTFADFTFTDFSDAPGLVLLDTAHAELAVLRLTENTPDTRGAAWFDREQLISPGFETSFWFRMSNPSGISDSFGQQGGDGFAFVIQAIGLNAIGNGGGGMGFHGLPQSLAVEFDGFLNPPASDPDSNHIAVMSRGTSPNETSHLRAELGHALIPGNFYTSGVHIARIRYSQQVLSVYLDDLAQPVLVATVDINSLLELGDSRAYVGFTSGVGSAQGRHDILAWTFVAEPPPCIGDLNYDGNVGLQDLSILLAHFGSNGGGSASGDLDENGQVDLADLTQILSQFGTSCE